MKANEWCSRSRSLGRRKARDPTQSLICKRERSAPLTKGSIRLARRRISRDLWRGRSHKGTISQALLISQLVTFGLVGSSLLYVEGRRVLDLIKSLSLIVHFFRSWVGSLMS